MTPLATAACQRVSSLSCPSGPYLTIDRDVFWPRFNARSCFVHHQLCDHPLLAVPRLLELARWLPSRYVRINSGNVPVNATPDQIPGTGLSLEASFERLEDSDTRIMLKKIELHPEYRDLLHTCLGELEALGHPATRGIRSREGYVFLSAPNMITPYHMDPEINFLLQIRGRKVFYVLPGDDRSILSEQDIELFYTGKHHSLTFKEEAKQRAAVFDMAPGDGVHIPVNHPHWVTTGNEVTISFALTLQTSETHRRGTIYAANHYLRRCGLKPTPFGHSAVRDFLKHQSYRLWRALKFCLPHRRRTLAH
jgi:Cupin-like domain